MKKKVFSVITLVTLVIVVIVKVNVDKNSAMGVLLANVEALANASEGDGTLWFRLDEDCVYTFKGKANTNFTFTIGGHTLNGTYDRNGEYTYTVSDGQTDCESGGRHQCTARYCD